MSEDPCPTPSVDLEVKPPTLRHAAYVLGAWLAAGERALELRHGDRYLRLPADGMLDIESGLRWLETGQP